MQTEGSNLAELERAQSPHHPRLAGPESSSSHTLCLLFYSTQLEPQHPRGIMDMKRVLGKCRQRKDELLAQVPGRQNLLLFSSGQENIQQVENQPHTGFEPGLGQTKALNISPGLPGEKYWNKTLCPHPKECREEQGKPCTGWAELPKPSFWVSHALGRKPERMKIK